MFTLTKILSLFVYPLSLGLLFVGLSLWGQLRGNRAAAGLYTFLALGVIYVPSTQFGVDTLAAPLEAPLLGQLVVLDPVCLEDSSDLWD